MKHAPTTTKPSAREQAPLGVQVWRSRLYERLSGSPAPLFVFEGRTLPAAALWNLSKLYTAWLRGHDIGAGDRLVLDLPEGPAFVAAVLAGLREGCTLAIPPLSAIADPVDQLADRYDARVVLSHREGRFAAEPDSAGLPPTKKSQLRRPVGEPTTEAQFFLSTSGSTGAAKHLALSAQGVLSVLDSHLPFLGMSGCVVGSVLPWRHAFGLVLELLAALFTADVIVRCPSGGRDPEEIAQLCEDNDIDWLSAVPLTIDRLARGPVGEAALDRLKGGIVGGAPAWPDLAQRLSETRLRVGYGQTEASPGICLGAPGVWRPGYIGRPIGCSTKVDQYGALWFQGDNAYAGEWRDGLFHRLPPTRWVNTGDLVRTAEDGLEYLGRFDDRFKLANGRWIAAGALEAELARRVPTTARVAIVSIDAQRLSIAYESYSKSTSKQLTETLSELGFACGTIHQLNTADWPTNAKGAVDRNILATQLASAVRPTELPCNAS